MENQIPESQVPEVGPLPQPGTMPPFDLEAMKAKARELAIQQAIASGAINPQQIQQQPPQPITQPTKVVYVRRNLTVAELIVVFALACGVVIGIPNLWRFVSSALPQIEIKVKQ